VKSRRAGIVLEGVAGGFACPVAVAVGDLLAEGAPLELDGVVFEVRFDFLLDVDVLRVELVLPGRRGGGLGGAEAAVERSRSV
jgi:hypothetical protein